MQLRADVCSARSNFGLCRTRLCRNVVWLLTVVLTALQVATFAQTFTGLAAGTTFIVGKRVRSIAVADFNGDGLPDIAVAGFGSSQVNVLLSCASGTNCTNGFLPVTNYPVGAPIAIVTADVNGDGKLDLLVASEGSNTVALFLGQGDGTFVSSKCSSSGLCFIGGGPAALAVGNFKGRLKEVDLVVVNSADNTVSVLLGNGVNFGIPKTYSVGRSPTSVAVADLNGDGFQDLVVTNGADNTVSVLLGNGKGDFIAKTPPATGISPVSVAIADFNGDHIPDLAVANSAGNSVSILLGAGSGKFQPATNINAGSYPQSVAVGDFNGDGHVDLAVADGSGNGVTTLLGNGDGTFMSGVQYASGAKTVSATVADVNGDKKQDLIVVNADLLPGQITVLLGNGDGTFQSGLNYGSTKRLTITNPQGITSADFNCDGKPDLAVANAGNNTVGLLFGNGDGTFRAGLSLGAGHPPVAIVTADFNHDGFADLATVNPASGDVTVLLANPTCTGFKLPVNYNLGVGVSPVSLAAADFNGDGVPDIVVANSGNSTNPGGIIVLLNRGDGTFGPPILTSAGLHPNFVIAADFNGNRRQDIAVTNQDSGDVSILLGNGDGTFTLKSTNCVGNILCKGVPSSVAAADFNGDGKLDLAVTNYDDTSVSILLGNGDGTFGAPKVSTVWANPLYVVAAPIQGNSSQQDLVIANSENDTVCVLLNQLNRSGGFKGAPQHTYATGEAPAALTVADFNADGKLDVAVANQASNNVTVLKQK
ncbi:MAG: hypothetical protein JWQ87_3238 [Candidatus Sulfotelmatobacter sp.]|nr:hypothetical protein [Candidatus Sulfotelmatobacter sp.]